MKTRWSWYRRLFRLTKFCAINPPSVLRWQSRWQKANFDACSVADLAIAVTGVAGPEPDENGNPVELVYVAVAKRNGEHFTGDYQLGPCPEDTCGGKP
jgi:hypothetical protein